MTPDQERELGRLMTSAQEGDRQAYEDLLTRVAALVHAFVRRRVGDVQWSEDVVQETLVALHRARHTYDVSRPFAPWMYAIVQNRLVDALRAQRRRLLREIQPDLTAEPSPVPAGAGCLARGRATRGGLPERQRQVIELLKFRI